MSADPATAFHPPSSRTIDHLLQLILKAQPCDPRDGIAMNSVSSVADFNDYKVSMMRKAKSHSARKYKFRSQTTEAPAHLKDSARKLIERNMQRKWEQEYTPKLDKIYTAQNVSEFRRVQEGILDTILKEPSEERRQMAATSCAAALATKLLKMQRKFAERSCPNTGNVNLFAVLGLLSNMDAISQVPRINDNKNRGKVKKDDRKTCTDVRTTSLNDGQIQASPKVGQQEIDFKKQVSMVQEPDRGLNLMYDSRWEGFRPTSL